MSPDLAKVIRILLNAEEGAEASAELMHAEAQRTGDRIHEILKGAAMRMPSTHMAIGMALHVAARMLIETIEFGEKSMDGDKGDAALIRAAALQLFVDLVNGELPKALARPS